MNRNMHTQLPLKHKYCRGSTLCWHISNENPFEILWQKYIKKNAHLHFYNCGARLQESEKLINNNSTAEWRKMKCKYSKFIHEKLFPLFALESNERGRKSDANWIKSHMSRWSALIELLSIMETQEMKRLIQMQLCLVRILHSENILWLSLMILKTLISIKFQNLDFLKIIYIKSEKRVTNFSECKILQWSP